MASSGYKNHRSNREMYVKQRKESSCMPMFIRNTEKHGLEISFEEIPSESIRTELKRNGFLSYQSGVVAFSYEISIFQ